MANGTPHSGNLVKTLRQRFLSQDALADCGVWGNLTWGKQEPVSSWLQTGFFTALDNCKLSLSVVNLQRKFPHALHQPRYAKTPRQTSMPSLQK